MTHRIITNDNGTFTIASQNGNLARNTNCEIYVTRDHDKAQQAVEFLNAGCPKTGAHWLKSTFGRWA